MTRKIKSSKNDLAFLVVRYNKENSLRIAQYTKGQVIRSAPNNKIIGYKKT